MRAAGAGGTPAQKVATPGQRTVEEVSAFLDVPPARFVKSLVYVVDGGAPVLAMVRGDHTLSEAKLKDALGAQTVALATEDVVARVTGAPLGFAGPLGLPGALRRIGDRGARRRRRRRRGRERGRSAPDRRRLRRATLADVALADLRVAADQDRCPRCDGRLVLQRGIEVGQVFYLGTKYSVAMKATVLDAAGAERVLEMGCYGIGVTRTIAAAIEQNHDDAGIIWPMPLAPFHVAVVPVNWQDERLRTAAERLHDELEERGIEVLLDDREERPGVKFKDADLIGYPLRVTIGPRALERGAVEVKGRTESAAAEVPLDRAADHVAALVAAALGGTQG